MSFDWSPHVENLTELWARGLSCSQIAGVLGNELTRNAVIGKVHRLKLPRRKTIVATPRARRPRQPRLPAPPRIETPKPFTPLVERIEPLPGSSPVLFVERRIGFQCAWPLWDDTTPPTERMCCGAPQRPGSSYCPHHSRMAWRPK